jgi:hypothetical protein
MRERRVESQLGKEIKALGGWSIKILPSVAGLPDRLVLLNGQAHFVETKSPTGTVEPHQTVIHGRLERLGFPVTVLATPEQVTEWTQTLANSRQR